MTPFSSSDHGPHNGKIFPVIAFRQNLLKILHTTGIFRSAIMTYLKNFLISLPHYFLISFHSSPTLVENPVYARSKPIFRLFSQVGMWLGHCITIITPRNMTWHLHPFGKTWFTWIKHFGAKLRKTILLSLGKKIILHH